MLHSQASTRVRWSCTVKGSICLRVRVCGVGRGALRIRSQHKTALSSITMSGKNYRLIVAVWEALSVFTGAPTTTTTLPNQKVKAHIFLLTFLCTSINSLFRSVAGKSGNYDSLIAGNRSEKLAPNRDRQQAKE